MAVEVDDIDMPDVADAVDPSAPLDDDVASVLDTASVAPTVVSLLQAARTRAQTASTRTIWAMVADGPRVSAGSPSSG
ncbi:MAG: hypothetical protein U0168_07985 [Nannocystaceae bacterium]